MNFFDYTVKEYQGYFPDVEPEAWYTAYVEAAKEMGLIEGYIDGSFQPNKLITRAEACTIVNRALGRKPHEDYLLPEQVMVTWPDCNEGEWYYAAMMEATNSHDYEWTSEDEDERVENWTEKLEQRDWAAFERAWSDAYSAPFEGEVIKN